MQRIFYLRAFKKYSKERSEKNSFGLVWNATLFFICFSMTFIMRLVLNPEGAHLPFLSYPLVAVVLVFFWRKIAVKTPEVQDFFVAFEYILGLSFACHLQMVRGDYFAFFVYFLIAICCAALLLVQPVFLWCAQVIGAIAFFVCARVSLGSITAAGLIAIGATLVIGILLGMLVWFTRMESISFSNELYSIANAADERFVGEKSSSFEALPREHGTPIEKTIQRRKSFTVVFNLSKERVEMVRENNVFSLKPGMDWDEVKNRILRCAGNPETYRTVEKFLSNAKITEEYKREDYRRTVSGVFNTYNGDRMWLNLESNLRPHPVTGAIMSTLVIEDVTEDMTVAEILKKLIINDYEILMCINRNHSNTLTYRVSGDGIVKGYTRGDYETEMVSYVTDCIADYDRERALKCGHLRQVYEELREKDVYEFVVDENLNGEIRTKRVVFSYLTPNKRTVIMQVQDITDNIKKNNETKRTLEAALEQANAANNIKIEFLSRMSHEMRTPMNAIMGLSTLIEDEVNNPEALRDYVAKIKNSSDFLLQLINDVLDMSYLEDGKMKLSEEEVSIREIMESVENLIAPMCKAKNLNYINRSDVPINTVIKTDKLRLTQIFINLLDNAVKYTNDGGRVEFNSYVVGERNGRMFYRFVVKDSGIGMSEEFVEHIFEPFSQEKESNKQCLNGTGLGLPITKGIVSMLGGNLSVSTKKDVGSTFVVDLDFDVVKEAPKVDEIADVDVDYLDGKRILVVEDNEINREIAVAILNKKGMLTDTAVNGREAVEMYDNAADLYYDAVLMDIRMPVMNGLEATRAIRKLKKPDAAIVPIIAMTANAFSDDISLSVHSGMSEHLSKPINPQLLYETLVKTIVAASKKK